MGTTVKPAVVELRPISKSRSRLCTMRKVAALMTVMALAACGGPTQQSRVAKGTVLIIGGGAALLGTYGASAAVYSAENCGGGGTCVGTGVTAGVGTAAAIGLGTAGIVTLIMADSAPTAQALKRQQAEEAKRRRCTELCGDYQDVDQRLECFSKCSESDF